MEDKDYKKLYEEAIERAKYTLTTDMDDSGHWAVNYIFPQLNENKDEKIRKALIHLVKSNKEGSFGIDNYDGVKWDDILSWIEIQEEHKHFRDCIQTGDEVTRNQDGDIVNLSQLRRIAKPKPKFKTGDWVQIDGGHVMKILEVKKDVLCYRILNWCGNESVRKISDIDSIAHPWTIQDAKGGDVLATDDGSICVFDGTVEESKYPFAYCGLTRYGFESYDRKLPFTHDDVHPATKEQSDLLFQKMKETGYEWDAEKKELRTIEQKPTWSEEDERILYNVIAYVGFAAGQKGVRDDAFKEANSWLKSLKDRVQFQVKQECSEDETTWKPSEEQLETLWNAIIYVEECGSNFRGGRVLELLYNELKQL